MKTCEELAVFEQGEDGARNRGVAAATREALTQVSEPGVESNDKEASK
jgi:hypothetical protein